ncbi:MAG: hypothetical protein ACJA2Q_000363 [Pseudohongiellaceae bacterium]
MVCGKRWCLNVIESKFASESGLIINHDGILNLRAGKRFVGCL